MYNTVDGPSEVELHIEDANPEAIFSEALMALSDVISEASGGTPVTHEIQLRGADLGGLLGAWVDELVRLAEHDGFVPERVEKLRLETSSLSAVIAGERGIPQESIRMLARSEHDVSRLEDGAWSARVVLSA